ncbi:cobyric acid synthase [Halorubrum gandharaense]
MTIPDARTILVAGTASHAGKSTVAAGLCRHLADAGVDVAPFKAQNMSNNARAVPVSMESDSGSASNPGEVFGEIGVSQYVQARAARVPPETDHNPVLLKPRGDGESQLVVDGEAVAHYGAGDYYADHWHDARDAAVAAHRRLATDHEVVVAEGAGSIAEINLHDRDLANVETVRFAADHGDVDVLLVADIERGGVFASLVGTLELVPDDVREQVVGAVITKFRGDQSLLEPGLDAFEERTGVPVLGVIPYDDPGLPEEDSVGLPDAGTGGIQGADDDVPDDRAVTIAVPRLPRISNATDLEPLAAEPGVRVQYVPVGDGAERNDATETDATDALADADAVVIPGSKNTVDDLLACRESGFLDALAAFEGPVVGLCGGYQILGDRIRNAGVESATLADADAVVEAAGLLPVETTFDADKRVVATELRVDAGATDALAGDETHEATGYEIHMGETRIASAVAPDAVTTPVSDPDGDRAGVPLGAARGSTVGTYLHGLFENAPIRRAFLDAVRASAGVAAPEVGTVDADEAGPQSPYDHAAALVRDNVDIEALSLSTAPDE